MSVNEFIDLVDHHADFPKQGILFRDVSPLLRDPKVLSNLISHLSSLFANKAYDVICGIEARGLIFGTALALQVEKPFVMARKKGKLPGKTITNEYSLEYGDSCLEMQVDAIKAGEKVLIIDDILATGGTAKSAAKLIEKLGGQVVGIGFIVELTELQGKKILDNYFVQSVMTF